MKAIICTLILAASTLCHADKSNQSHADWRQPGCLVFGDSLTSPSYSWAAQLDDRDIVHMMVSAWPGRRMVELMIPDDIFARGDMSCAIIWLGGNDALSKENQLKFKMHTVSNARFLVDRGFKVFLVQPPLFDLIDTTAYRKIIADVATDLGIALLDPAFDLDQAVDGIHPTYDGHFNLAYWFMMHIDLTN